MMDVNNKLSYSEDIWKLRFIIEKSKLPHIEPKKHRS